MSASAMRAQAPKRPELTANQRQYVSKLSETEIRVPLNGFLTVSSCESLGCADVP